MANETVDLRGKVAWVTGGGRGLGAATALALAEAGADVALMARDSCEVLTVAELIRAQGRQALGIAGDVADWEDVRAAADQISEAIGPVAILVNNAAVTQPFGPLLATEPQAWAYAINVNLNGAYFCARAALPGMIEAGWGRVINVSTGLAVNTMAGASAYSASKAGLDHMTRVLALELKATGVATMTLNPGVMDTAMQTQLRGAAIPETERFRQFHERQQLRPPEESAALVRWLCGPAGDEWRGQSVNAYSSALRARAGLPELPPEQRQP